MRIENVKLKIVFFGTPQFVIPVLDGLVKNYNSIAVVTVPDQKTGRKQILTPSPIKQHCSTPSQHIQIITPQHLNKEAIEQIRGLKPDLFVVAAYGKILPKELLAIPKFGALNIHPSNLPKYRGPTPIQAAILNGDQSTGVTIIKMDEKMDHGPILESFQVGIKKNDTFQSVAERAFSLSIKPLLSIIHRLENNPNNIYPSAQYHYRATFTSIIKKIDGFIDLENPPDKTKLDRMIRAYYPWPNAWTRLRLGSGGQAKIVKFLPDKKIQVEGGKPMNLKDFLNGYPEAKEIIQTIMM